MLQAVKKEALSSSLSNTEVLEAFLSVHFFLNSIFNTATKCDN
jgi:hypothetical protein